MKTFDEINSELRKTGILPILCLKSEEEVNTFMEALVPTPIRSVELTMRHPYAPTAVRYIKEHYPEFMVGAGTIVNKEILHTVIEAGADYFVSPGFDEIVIQEAQREKVPFLPGCITPSEILKALNYGITTVKFFPCEASGGVPVLNLFEGAFPNTSFIPTGGITKENLNSYLGCKNVVVCDGNFMVNQRMLEAGDSEGLYNIVKETLEEVKKAGTRQW